MVCQKAEEEVEIGVMNVFLQLTISHFDFD